MRIRSTKPEFWRSERIASVSWEARLVLKGLESYVDDNGVGKDDLALIVADVFPRDLSRNPTGTLQRVSEAIFDLSKAGLLWRYEVDGQPLLYLSFWESFQRIEKPSAGRFRRPDGTSGYRESVILAPLPEDSGSIPVALRPGTGEQGNRGTVLSPDADAPESAQHDQPPAPPKPPRRKPETPIPDDWRPADDHQTYAREHQLDLGQEAFRFRNHAISNDRRCRDWNAAFRNWLSKATPATVPPQRRAERAAAFPEAWL